MIVVTLVMLGLLYLFFRGSRSGLAMRAAAANPELARLVGIRVGWMIALGWGMSAAIGAVAGMLIAPVVFLEPNMMLGVLLYGFAGGGARRAVEPGAVRSSAALLVGVIENLAGTFIPYVGREMKLTFALIVIVAVLMVRPARHFRARRGEPGMSAPEPKRSRERPASRCRRRRRFCPPRRVGAAPATSLSAQRLVALAAPLVVQNFITFQLTLVMVYGWPSSASIC